MGGCLLDQSQIASTGSHIFCISPGSSFPTGVYPSDPIPPISVRGGEVAAAVILIVVFPLSTVSCDRHPHW